MIQIVRSMASVAPLFAGWQETIIWSCLQGEMGEVYAPVNFQSIIKKSAYFVFGRIWNSFYFQHKCIVLLFIKFVCTTFHNNASC